MPSPDERMHLHVGDITRLAVDAIVNAANDRLLPGGGVCGAIFRAAGPELIDACRRVAPCPTGEACLTPGYRLPARYIIHAVGPVWRGGLQGEAQQLKDCYRAILRCCEAHNIRHVAIPAISCGIFGYPPEAAAPVAVREVRDWLSSHDLPAEVTFCLFSDDMAMHYKQALDGSRGGGNASK